MKKRTYLSLFALVTSVALLTGYGAWGQQRRWQADVGCAQAVACCPAPAPGCPVACATAAPFAMGSCALRAPENTKLVEELRGLLQDTSSRDTFLLTVKALADIGSEARSAVPAIIRGAERLGLSKDIEQQFKGDDGPGMMIVECIERILVIQACAPAYAGVLAAPAPPVFVPPPCLPAPCWACPVEQTPPLPRFHNATMAPTPYLRSAAPTTCPCPAESCPIDAEPIPAPRLR